MRIFVSVFISVVFGVLIYEPLILLLDELGGAIFYKLGSPCGEFGCFGALLFYAFVTDMVIVVYIFIKLDKLLKKCGQK
ncbi:hypothetical protein BKG95_09890 [Rodentibacter pneumotropicus]|uniref:Uncharacterized protein n=1 Tax=Rodentibacter pneumotropicus TaxID=758 RepID=A0AAW5LC49_9PAST|nr:hypothetical protein [Rodentibacter pneumotropicus]MCQ9121142.1 hypothetical protein [Rodentibacter pneumotropicus]OOF66511.1 hypothetical protein BKG95_09890 [Rodentibacter pneumotropicus]